MGLGDLIEQTFKKVIDYVVELADDFADVLRRGILMIIEQFERDVAEDYDKIFPKEFKDYPLFANWESYIKEKAGKKPAVSGIILSSLIGGAIGTGVGMGLGGFGRDIQNFFNTKHPVTPLPPELCGYYLNRNPTDTDKVELWLKQSGFDTDKHYTLLQYFKPKLSISEIVTAYLRGVIDEKQFNYLLSEHGLSERDIDYLKKIIWAYPSPTDFIRFAVREVFTKDKDTQEALSAEFPEDIVPYAEKAGMSKDVLMWYWKAHWELPSPTQVYEMLHRLNPDVLAVRGDAYKEMGLELDKLQTTKETVEFYLKQADYDKRWRQRLLAISYNPLTRVDLRRIYELGLIDDNELLVRLMEVGYTKKDAKLMVEFYKTFRQEEARTFAKTEIKYLLYYGIINETEARIMLERLGYTEEDAKTMIELWKVKLAEKDMRETQKFVRDAYSLGEITREEAERLLKEIGLSKEVIAVVLDKEDKRRLKSVKLPSASTVVKWLKNGIITKDKAREILRSINVKEEYIEYYIKEAEVEGGE